MLRKLRCIVTGFTFFSFASIGQSSNFEEYPHWREISPGGDTLCARGTPFSFFVSEGTSDKVVIDFIGGGACWDANTCSKEGSTFTDSVDDLREKYREGLKGVYDREDPRNPLKDWTHIVVPYCTGDIHWGSNDHQYRKKNGETFTIHHRGALNTKAVLEWVKKEYSQPDNVLVTGCSAGAYGSIYWTPYVREMYPEAKMVQMADSGTGIITREFFLRGFNNWDAVKAAPQWIPSLDPKTKDWTKLELNDLYRAINQHYPQVKLSQFNIMFDDVQTFFFEIMGGDPSEWTTKMLSGIDHLVAEVPNFSSYIAPGHSHCILPHESIHHTVSDGVVFTDWFKNLLDGENVPNVICAGDCEE